MGTFKDPSTAEMMEQIRVALPDDWNLIYIGNVHGATTEFPYDDREWFLKGPYYLGHDGLRHQFSVGGYPTWKLAKLLQCAKTLPRKAA